MKILFLQTGVCYGGAEESLLANVRGLSSRGHDCSVASLAPETVNSRLEAAGARVQRLACSPLRIVGLNRALSSTLWRLKVGSLLPGGAIALLSARASVRRLIAQLRCDRPDLVYGNQTVLNDFEFLAAAERLGIPVASHQRVGAYERLNPVLLEHANRRFGMFISNSVWTCSQWIAGGLRADRHQVVYNVILPVGEDGPDLRTLFGLPADALIVASIGRLSPEKRFDEAIRAFGGVARRNPRMRLVLIGDGPCRDLLEAQAAQCAPAGSVIFAGERPGAARLIRSADILLHCARAEPFGRVLAEAMLAGVLVMTHVSGGAAELVRDGETGFGFGDGIGATEACLGRALHSVRQQAILDRARRHAETLCGEANIVRLEAALGVAAGRIVLHA